MEKPKNIKDGTEVVEFYKKQNEKMTSLHDQFEADYARWRLEKIRVVGKEEGDYDVVITNRPRVFADKLVSELSDAKLKLTIAPFGKKREREAASMTEQTAYGLLEMANDLNLSRPYGKKVQDAMAWHLVNRGIVAIRCWVSEEEVNGETRLCPDIAIWDKLTTEFESSRYGLSRICHTRQTTADQIEGEYGIKVQGDNKENVVVYDYFDEEDEVVVVDGEIVYVMAHKRGYVPARVITCGSTPFIESTRFSGDTLKDMVESAYSKNRDIWDLESRILSYQTTIVGMAAHTPIVVEYDSSTGAGPPEVKKNPWQQNSQITLDKAKGQTVAPLFKPVLPQDAAELHGAILQLEGMGSAPPILYGRQDRDATAQGTAMLIHAGMGALKNGKSAMETGLTWIVNEAIRQYKDGEFETVQFQAMDRTEKKFSITVEREKLLTDRRIEAELDIYTPQDQMQNIGMASTSVKTGLLSKQTARERYLSVEDTDAEQQVIDREEGEAAAGVKLRHLHKALIEDGDEVGAAWVGHQLEMMTQAMMKQMTGGDQGLKQPGGGEERLPGSTEMPQPPMPMEPGLQDIGQSRPMKPETVMGRLRNALGRRGQR